MCLVKVVQFWYSSENAEKRVSSKSYHNPSEDASSGHRMLDSFFFLFDRSDVLLKHRHSNINGFMDRFLAKL